MIELQQLKQWQLIIWLLIINKLKTCINATTGVIMRVGPCFGWATISAMAWMDFPIPKEKDWLFKKWIEKGENLTHFICENSALKRACLLWKSTTQVYHLIRTLIDAINSLFCLYLHLNYLADFRRHRITYKTKQPLISNPFQGCP